MNIVDYYLDLKSLESLDNRNREFIHNYYRDMVHSFSDNRMDVGYSFFNTLVRGGYLKNLKEEDRDRKISEIL